MLTNLSGQPILLLALLLLLGALLGHVRIGTVAIGPAAVLFAAIAVSALGVANGVELQIPETVGTLGLVLFTYTIGIVSGPSFFASLRRGWPVMLSVVVTFVLVAVLAVLVGKALGLTSSVVAGTFAGGLTNTPALAAATERVADPAGPTIGYSIAYLWGVVGMLLAAAWSLRHRGHEEPPSEPLVNQTIRTERAEGVLLSDIEARYRQRVTFSRLKHGHFASPTIVADDDERLGPNDLVTVVGPRDLVDQVTAELGHRSSHDIVVGQGDLDYRRVTISNSTVAGRSVGALDLEGRFGAHISRVRRADVDLVAAPDFVLQMGDRVRVTAPADRMSDVGRFLGRLRPGHVRHQPGRLRARALHRSPHRSHPHPCARRGIRARGRCRHPSHRPRLRAARAHRPRRDLDVQRRRALPLLLRHDHLPRVCRHAGRGAHRGCDRLRRGVEGRPCSASSSRRPPHCACCSPDA